MKLAIVGSRELSSSQRDQVQFLLGAVVAFWRQAGANLVIISGGAIGVDSIAAQRATVEDVSLKQYLPDNKWWHPNGFRDRNIKIAEECDELICIRSVKSKSYGSGWTADYAEKIGRTVWRFYV